MTTDEISKAIESGKFVIGLKKSMKLLRAGKAARIVYASNIPEKLKKELTHYSEIAKVHTEMFNGSNLELGVKCKRAHGVLMIALMK